MAEKPILFSGEMVRAILEGRKSQTRRVLSYQPNPEEGSVYGPELFAPTLIDKQGFEEPGPEIYGVYGYDWSLKCPYGMPGDRLWVRETWRAEELDANGLDGIRFRADGVFREIENNRELSEAWSVANNNLQLWMKDKWRPSIYMPRWASRINLEIVKIRVERLQDIGEDDAGQEGINREISNKLKSFEYLWDSINAKRGFGWNVNPWVWVIEFKVV